jgi:hypothetical protein
MHCPRVPSNRPSRVDGAIAFAAELIELAGKG